MADILMKCGCRANAVQGDRPCCAVHALLTPLAFEVAETPNLEGRIAKCYCGKTEPSSLSLAFFEYLGPGSPECTDTCKHCRYFQSAHENPKRSPPVLGGGWCPGFEPIGARETDRYYCGHAGWD